MDAFVHPEGCYWEIELVIRVRDHPDGISMSWRMENGAM